MERSSTLRGVRWLLIVAGAVDLWTVASSHYVFVQVGAGAIAAIMFIASGLLWERYTPSLADELARHLFGAQTAGEGLITAASQLMVMQQREAEGS